VPNFQNRVYLLLLLLSVSGNVCGQNNFAEVDKTIAQIPDSLTVSTEKIAAYIKNHFESETEKARAVFYWTASNISYDIDNMFAINFNENEQDQINKTLESKKGICMHYARVFNDIANKVGVKTVEVEGYTMQNGFTDYIPHLWCASEIDGDWYVFDPTWGSGYIKNGKFVKKINNDYFKVNPWKIIETHMPFDYLWQFMNFPITNQEFYSHNTKIDRSKLFFDFDKEISLYETLDEIAKLEASVVRIEAMGVKNAMIFDRLAWKKRQLEYLKMKKNMDDFSVITNTYNVAINEMNEFIAFRNKHFKPEITDAQLKSKIDIPKERLIECQKRLKDFVLYDKLNQPTLDSFKKGLELAIEQFEEHEKFVTEYLKKTKTLRKMMFYKKL
jgi:transglutaminase/protease-like cytokinesis protein 3